MHLHISYQKLSALSASLARMVPLVEDEEAELDHFPAEGVSERQLSVLWTPAVTYKNYLWLKGSYDIAKKNIIWCNSMCLRLKKHFIFYIPYIVAPLCPSFLKRADFTVHRSEKRGMLWLVSYPVHCDWPDTSSVRRRCYAPYHVVMPCSGATRQKR